MNDWNSYLYDRIKSIMESMCINEQKFDSTVFFVCVANYNEIQRERSRGRYSNKQTKNPKMNLPVRVQIDSKSMGKKPFQATNTNTILIFTATN